MYLRKYNERDSVIDSKGPIFYTRPLSSNFKVLSWCREISQAQDRLTGLLQNVYKSCPQYREIIRMILSTVGRGGEGDVGQRIRDEILVIQVVFSSMLPPYTHIYFLFLGFGFDMLHELLFNCRETMTAKVE